ncbi:SDR family NAD(P)-dependent oxidoreductase [Pseudactinotalea sp. HY160]|uniref:SDR family oxidoreductase n=1 Tax=Pseudactinotalea sp. HY160 TaxID=2654490 RepID=UPI00128C6A22|nr:SDR family oxidoreductase [Pseudactinotalea sp. HY160]MPV51229.1 SDR family NAD(P)-dependent oxidoreductase [Pseudactinotalea sp. HY160]
MRHRPVQMRGATVVVTGGGRGLGRRMAWEAARRGADVVLWDADLDVAERAAERIGEFGGRCRADRVDVTDEAAVVAATERAGEVDVVVNNAGIVSGGELLANSSEQIRRTFAVNVLGAYWTTRALLPGMLERDRGAVVNIASAAGLTGVARQTDYSASKHAVIGFTESLRAELRGRPRCSVRTLLVCPYYIDTGMFGGVTTRFPHLLPILHEPDVARSVIDSVEHGREVLILPRLVRFLPALRLLPSPMFDRAMDFLGVNHTMDHFVGHGGGRSGP